MPVGISIGLALVVTAGLVFIGGLSGWWKRWPQGGALLVAATLPVFGVVPLAIWEVLTGTSFYRASEDLGAPLMGMMALSLLLLAALVLVWSIGALRARPTAPAPWYWLLLAAGAPPVVAAAGRAVCGTRLALVAEMPWLLLLAMGGIGAELWRRAISAPELDDAERCRRLDRARVGLYALPLAALVFGEATYHLLFAVDSASDVEAVFPYLTGRSWVRWFDLLAAVVSVVPLLRAQRVVRLGPLLVGGSMLGTSLLWAYTAILVATWGGLEWGVHSRLNRRTGIGINEIQREGLVLPVGSGDGCYGAPTLFLRADGSARYGDLLPGRTLMTFVASACPSLAQRPIGVSADGQLRVSQLVNTVWPCLSGGGRRLSLFIGGPLPPALGVYTPGHEPKLSCANVLVATDRTVGHWRDPDRVAAEQPWLPHPGVVASAKEHNPRSNDDEGVPRWKAHVWDVAPDGAVVARVDGDTISLGYRPGTSPPVQVSRTEPYAPYEAIQNLDPCRGRTTRVVLAMEPDQTVQQLIDLLDVLRTSRPLERLPSGGFPSSPSHDLEFWLTGDRKYVLDALRRSTPGAPICGLGAK